MPFRSYRFEHPSTEATELISRRSYLAAAFFGPFYILYRGSSGFFPSLALCVALTLGIVGVSGVGSYVLPNRMLLAAHIVAVPVALWIQSSFVIDCIKKSYRRRGWLTRAP
jgi:hypothetical protein